MEDSEEYKLEHASVYLREIKKNILYYGKVENKSFLDSKSAAEGADMIYECLQELKK